METKNLNLTHEEVSELYDLLVRRISELNRGLNRSDYPKLTRKYILRLQDIQLKVVSLLDSFKNED